MLFILGDGDRVRARVEGYLLSGDVAGLSDYSRSLTGAIKSAAAAAETRLLAKTLVAAGDDLFLKIEARRYKRSELEDISKVFRDTCGSTISFGVGPSIETAFLALRKAKAKGGNSIEEGTTRDE